jgi:mono/diheme cytochrome c family protein
MRSLLVVGALFMGWPALAADPKATYLTRCSMCHQSAAQGLPGQFPRLAGRAAQIAQTPEGRNYLARILLWGVYGPIEVDGTPINGLMPSMEVMTDADIAAVLNHVILQGKPAKAARPFKPAEIAAVRAKGQIAGSANAELRKMLVVSGVIQ